MLLRSPYPMMIRLRVIVNHHRSFFRSSSTIYPSSICPSSQLQAIASKFCVSKGVTGRAGRLHIRSMSSNADPSLGIISVPPQQGGLLSATDDKHGGVIVQMSDPINLETFSSSLTASLENWRQQGKRGVWLKLPIKLANLVQPAVQAGFLYHHAEPDYLMLVYWLPTTKSTLPVNATHRVGVGAFVMNDNREVLVVMEKNGMMRGLGVWKFPTGVVDPGEDIFSGAVREVKEETGIDTEFVEVLAFRQSHMSFFDKSDLFFICMLRPLSFDIKKQDSEIEAAKWMPIEEFYGQPFVEKHELLRYMIDVGMAKAENVYAGMSPVCTTSALTNKRSYLYLNTRDLNQKSR